MKYSLFLIPVSLLIFMPTSFAEGTCAIDGQLSPKLAEYVREMNDFGTKIKQLPSSCAGGKSNGIVSNSQRTLDTVEKAWAETSIMDRLDVDFAYNIKMAFKWESRDAVVQNGKIFWQVEKMLISTLDVLASKCNLDETNENAVTGRIKANNLLETLYQETAVWYPGVNTDDIPSEYQAVVSEIQQVYNPTATQWCKNQYSFEKMSEEIMNKIGKISFKIESSLTDWKYAIALLRGGSSLKQEEYSSLKKRLLTEELRRQGYSAGAIDQMVQGYTCMESAMQGDEENRIMDFASAKYSCARISILWVDRFMKEWNKMLLGSKWARTIAWYLNRYANYDEIKQKNIDSELTYTNLESMFTEDIPDNEDFLNKFIDLHIMLLDVNERIGKRINPAIKNCKKTQPNIPCDF